MTFETQQATSSGRAEGVLPQDVLQHKIDTPHNQPMELNEGINFRISSLNTLINKLTPGIVKRKQEEKQTTMFAELKKREDISNAINELNAIQRRIREKGFPEPTLGPSPTTTLAE